MAEAASSAGRDEAARCAGLATRTGPLPAYPAGRVTTRPQNSSRKLAFRRLRAQATQVGMRFALGFAFFALLISLLHLLSSASR